MEVKEEPAEHFVLTWPTDEDSAAEEGEEDDNEPLIEVKEEPQAENCLLELLPSPITDQPRRARTRQRTKKQSIGGRFKRDSREHPRLKPIHICAVCDVKFSSKVSLDRHRNEFHGTVLKCDKFKCDNCSFRTIKGKLLKSHKRTHSKPLVCSSCQKPYSTNKALARHQQQQRHGIYANSPEVAFVCDICDKLYPSSKRLKLHQKSVHENEVNCTLCNKVFKSRKLLHEHSQTHVKNECSICNKKVSKRSMARHMQMHFADNPFMCELCDFTTTTKRGLKLHIERVHLLKKLVQDSKSRDDFDDFELLDKLQLQFGSSATTSGSEMKFGCGKCSKWYASQKALNEHESQVHFKVSCSVCNKMVGKRELKRHVKSHEPVDFFDCDFCTYKSKQMKWLQKHITNKHLTQYVKAKALSKYLLNPKTLSKPLFSICKVYKKGKWNQCDFDGNCVE